ncbi:hypothetical protein SDJN03_29045, partial [Cucurbita argyrosperma subsp. sororia]
MPLFSKLGSRVRRAVDARRVYQEKSLERVTSSKSESASHWRPALPPILEDSKGARLPVKKSGEKKKTYSRQEELNNGGDAVLCADAVHVLKAKFGNTQFAGGGSKPSPKLI